MREARSFSLFFLPAAWPMTTSAWQPQVDIYRTRDGWVVKLELAGVRPQDVSITTHGSQLRVEGVRHDGSVAAGWRHYWLVPLHWPRGVRIGGVSLSYTHLHDDGWSTQLAYDILLYR